MIIGLSFLLLTIAFRSFLVPLKAAAMNLLSIGAAYGVVVMVFQYGWFSGLVGLEGEVPIVSFLPLLMFAGLFGLSMDYEVFLMSHVQEHYREGRSPRDAIVIGLAESASVITAAALIMVAVFASFILNGDPTIKQFGVGLSVAVIIDATIVRCLLVPATMALMGRCRLVDPAAGSTGACRRSASRATATSPSRRRRRRYARTPSPGPVGTRMNPRSTASARVDVEAVEGAERREPARPRRTQHRGRVQRARDPQRSVERRGEVDLAAGRARGRGGLEQPR